MYHMKGSHVWDLCDILNVDETACWIRVTGMGNYQSKSREVKWNNPESNTGNCQD